MKNYEVIPSIQQGNFTQISNEIIKNNKITSNAFRLFCRMKANSDNWHINLTFFAKEFEWHPSTLADAVKNLIKNGYLKKEKKSTGKKFFYEYTLDENGKLLSKQEKSTIKQETPEEISSTDFISDMKLIYPDVSLEKLKRYQDFLLGEGYELTKENLENLLQ